MSATTRRGRRDTDFDPEAHRMSVGEHLDELRRRMIYGLLGLGGAFVICLIFGERVMMAFCLPLLRVMHQQELNPQLFFAQMTDPLMVYIKISLISAAAIASPWIFYQIWNFVAAGLYPSERKVVTRYLPLSIALLIAGMLLVYFMVLPLALDFLIRFGTAVRLPAGYQPEVTVVAPPAQRVSVPVLAGDPAQPQPGEIWFNTIDQRLKMQLPPDPRQPEAEGRVRNLAFLAENLLSPLPTLPEYISLVVAMLLAFGLCFQLPLVVMAANRLGFVDIEGLKSSRKYVYFGLAVLSAVVTPMDVISMIALMIPLILLYEFGIWMAQWNAEKPAEKET